MKTAKPQHAAMDPAIVVRTLAELGGAAHLSTLFHKLQPKLAAHEDMAELGLADLLATLKAYQSPRMQRVSADALFHQPFGDGSYRWCLCEGVL
jgi:hypothetical protein